MSRLDHEEPAAEPTAPAADDGDAPPRAPGEPAPAPFDKTFLVAAAIAAVVLFPMLAKSGIWDPYELDAADFARRIAVRAFGAKGLELPNAPSSMPTLSDLKMGELGFTSMALGFKVFGLRSFAGRIPLAIWAFSGAVALYQLLARLVDRKAGLYAVIALVTMPLYFMQARTMLGDIVTMSALTLAFTGLTGAMLDDRPAGPRWARFAWMGVAAIGLVSGYFSRGLLIGVAVPALAAGLGWLALRGGGDARRGALFDAVGAFSLGLGVVAVALGLRYLAKATPEAPLARAIGFALVKKPPTEATFDLVFRQLGHALFPWSAFLPFAIGRLMRAPVEAPPEAEGRETGARVMLLVGAAVCYGAFALIAPRTGSLAFSGPALLAGIAALAIFDFERGAPPSRAVALGCLVLGAVLCGDLVKEPEKALAAFVVDKPQFPKSFEADHGRITFVALAAFAGLLALTWFEAQPKGSSEKGARAALSAWADDQIEVYRDGVADLARVWNGNLLFGLVVVEAALVGLGGMIFVGKRVHWQPVEKLSKNFADLGVNAWWAAPLAGFVLPIVLFALRDGFRKLVAASRTSRASFTVIAALAAGGAQSFWYYPALAAQISPKEAFEAYGRIRRPGEPLALLGVRSRAAAYYAGGEVESFNDANRAFNWMTEREAERRFLLLKADDLPKLNSLYRQRKKQNLPVADGRSSQILLVSNQLGDRPNESWLAKIVLDERPSPARPIDAMFEDQLEAIGWEVRDRGGDIADSVVPATKYHLRVFLRVAKPITGTWKAFVHIDGFQRRFNGDHPVADGRYAMNLWQPGDVVVDDLEFQLEPNFTPGDYTVYFGFFAGETRFRVTRGSHHDNRLIIGTIRVR